VKQSGQKAVFPLDLTITNMKKNTLMIALLAGALIAPELLAQQNPNRPQQPRPGQARGNIGRVAEQLELTEKQRALFQDRNTPREQVREKFNALRKETREKQEKILTKEQLEKYKQLTQGRGQARPGQDPGGRPGPGAGARPGGGRPGGGFGGFGRNLFGDLDLNEKQQEKINAINEARGAEMRQMFEDLRDGSGDRQALMEKFRALGEKYQKQIEEVLTDEQKKKMAEMSAQRGQGQGGRGQGQPRPGGFGRRDPFASMELKEDQKKKLDAARQEMSDQLRELFSDRETPREERSAKMQKVREAYEATIKKTLSAEQFKKYQEARSQRGQRGPGGFGGGRRPGGERPPQTPRPRRDDI